MVAAGEEKGSSGETLMTPGTGEELTPGQTEASAWSLHLAKSTYLPRLELAWWALITLTPSHHLSPAGVWPSTEGDSGAG